MNQLTRIVVLLLALAMIAAGGLGCADSDAKGSSGDEDAAKAADAKQQEDDESEEEAIPVEVAELGRGAIRSVLRFSSNLEAERSVGVFSEAKRLVRELKVEEGDFVRRGQVLLRLDDGEQRSALEKVRSQLERSEREYARQKRLFEQKMISDKAFNDAAFDLEQLRISLKDSERELGYTEVRAPIRGTITSRMVKVGDQVQIGQHLFDMVDFDSMVARVFVPEKHLPDLKTGLLATITPAAAADSSYQARVDRIAPVVDPQSGTVKVTVAVGGQPGLRPGMYVNVDLVTATNADAVLVPKRALVYDNDQMFVYRLREADRRVDRVYIEPQLTDKDWVEPLDGIESGDLVVVAGQAGLKDDALVDLGDESEAEDATAELADEPAEDEEKIPS